MLKSTGSGPVSSGGLMQLPTSFTLMPGESSHRGQIEHAESGFRAGTGEPLSLLRRRVDRGQSLREASSVPLVGMPFPTGTPVILVSKF